MIGAIWSCFRKVLKSSVVQYSAIGKLVIFLWFMLFRYANLSVSHCLYSTEFIPSRELTYPTFWKGKSSSNWLFRGYDMFVSRSVHIYTVSILFVCRQNRIPISPQEKWCRKIKWVTTHHVLQWHGMEVPWHTFDMSPFWDRSSGQSDMQWLRHQWRHCDEAPQNVLHFVACFTSYEPLRKLHINSWWEGAGFPTQEKTEKPRPSALFWIFQVALWTSRCWWLQHFNLKQISTNLNSAIPTQPSYLNSPIPPTHAFATAG